MYVKAWKSLKVRMSESQNVWNSACLKVWMLGMSDNQKVRMSESLHAWKSECLKCLKIRKSECLKVRMSESLPVWKSEKSECLKCLNIWMSESQRVWKSECLKCLKDVSQKSFVFTSALLDSEGCLARKLRFHICNCWNVKDLSQESFVYTSSPLGIWRTSCKKASFSHPHLLEFEGRLARKLRFTSWELRFHILTLTSWDLKDVSHESFVVTSATVGMWRTSRRKASFTHPHLLEFEGPLARNAFLRDSGCTKCCVLQDKTCLGWCVGKLVWRTVSEDVRFYRDHARIGPAVELPVQAWFPHLELSKFEGMLARKLRFHICKCWNLKDISHESFVFTSAIVGIWRASRTKASLSHLQLLDFEVWRASRTKASFTHPHLLEFEGRLLGGSSHLVSGLQPWL